ncbi:MAG: sigma-70 family RNA polymerase sigma factor [PVC group bacterium]
MDPKDFNAIYEKYGPLVWSMIGKMGVAGPDREDVFMESWEAVFSSIGTFDGQSKFSTWLARIVRNKSIDHIRKHILVPLDDEELARRADDAGSRTEGMSFLPRGALSPRAGAIRQEAADLIRTALDELSPQRKFIVGKWMIGFKYREIAEMLTAASDDPVDEKYVGKQIYYVKMILAEALAGAGIESLEDLLE